MKQVVALEPGGAGVMHYVDAEKPQPGHGEVLVRIAYAGVNFIDVYHRSGVYAQSSRPIALGLEASGRVEATGADVSGFERGQRVAYAGGRGSYAEFSAVPADKLVAIPDGIDDQTAAGALLQGMTAHYLSHSTYPLKEGDVALVHAAAGGVGQLLVQTAKLRRAQVIATVSSAVKAQKARAAGADHVVDYTQADFALETRRLTAGRGASVVYDSVGAATFIQSLDALQPRGMLVSFGNASGPVPPFAPLLLAEKGSLFVTRPVLAAYTATREELLWRANDVFSWLQQKKLRLAIDRIYPLADAASAHRDLEGRLTQGKLLLRVG
jgi:NADPH2:quinone reductase